MNDAAHTAEQWLLIRTAAALASINGPVSSGTATTALMAAISVIRTGRKPITAQTFDAILALIQSLREDITDGNT